MGKKYVWWAFSSCTESLEVLESQQFLGTSGERTLFNINCDNGKKVASYSSISTENEVILPPATQFVVKGKLNPSSGLYIVQLEETKPNFPLLELPITSSDSGLASNIEPAYSNPLLKHRISTCLPGCMYIGQFNLTDRDVPLIVKKAICTKKCSFLDLNHNNITAEGARLIANVLGQNTSLKVLRFWHNYLLDSGAGSIAQALCTNISLTTLCLTSNGLTDACTSNIARMLKENRTLTIFYLNSNTIGDDGMVTLMNSLRSNETLNELYLHCNAITDKSNNSIEKMFHNNHTLQFLSLDGNQFSKQGQIYLQNLAKQRNNFQFFV